MSQDINTIITCDHTDCPYNHEKECGKEILYVEDTECIALKARRINMKYITRDIDKEIVFFEGEEDKAREYWSVPEECRTLEEIADFWNAEHSGDAIGELKIY